MQGRVRLAISGGAAQPSVALYRLPIEAASYLCVSSHLPFLRLIIMHCASIMTNASLSGTLPPSLGCRDAGFQQLMVGNNSLSGSSSAQFAVWVHLKTLAIEHNPRLDWSLELLGNWSLLEHATMQVPLLCHQGQCAERLFAGLPNWRYVTSSAARGP